MGLPEMNGGFLEERYENILIECALTLSKRFQWNKPAQISMSFSHLLFYWHIFWRYFAEDLYLCSEL